MPDDVGYKLNPATERALLRQLLADPLAMPRLARHFKPAGLAVPEVRELATAALSYWKKTGAPPTRTALLEEVRQEVNEGRTTAARRQELAAFIEDRVMDTEPVATEYVVGRILEEERDRALGRALRDSIKLHRDRRFDEIVQEITRADGIGRPVTGAPGVDYGGTLATRTERRIKQGAPKRWGTGILELDQVMDGGLTLDNPMGLVLGPPKGGKSLYLSYVAMHTMATGGFVFLFSTEMGDGELINRMDASIAMVPTREVAARAEEVRGRVAGALSRWRGGMHVKAFPGGMVTTCREIDLYLQEARLELGIRPTMILLDHAGEMAANEKERHDRRHEELRAIASEFRALLVKHGCVGWTANHITKDGTDKKHAGLTDAAGAYAQVFIADAVVTIARTEEEKKDEKVRMYLAGSRFSGDGEPIGPLPSAFGVGRFVMQDAG